MEYIIRRTSVWDDEMRPSEEAYLKMCPCYEIRSCTESEYNMRFAPREDGLWQDKGSEHSVTHDGYIRRRKEDTIRWCINIISLEELEAFRIKHGNLVLQQSSFDNNMPMIEIYDDYRE